MTSNLRGKPLMKLCLLILMGLEAFGYEIHPRNIDHGKKQKPDLLDASEKFIGSLNWGNPASTRIKFPDDNDEAELGDMAKEVEQRAFSGGSDASFRKTGHSTFGGSSSGKYSSSFSSSSGRAYAGGCLSKPEPPMNAALRCAMFSGCHATCHRNHQFPNGETQLYITCRDGEWHIEGVEWDTIPSCEPICLPACQNNGICVAPNQCNCPENFRGPQCQYENKPCMNFPPMPSNSMRKCSMTSCSIQCAPNHQFPDGSVITNMICKDGSWVPSRPDWVSIPDCEVVCKPPCKNGGICLSYNMCQCPKDFRGPQCQYDADSCSAKNLGFNGAYNCTASGTLYSCSLSCPVGVDFEFPAAAIYTCNYATGLFSPSPIPQCKYGGPTSFGGSSFERGSSGSFGYSSSGSYGHGSSGSSGSYSSSGAYGHGSSGSYGSGSHGRSSSGILESGSLESGYSRGSLFPAFPSKGFKFPGGMDMNYGKIPHNLVPDIFVIEEKTPTGGSCFTWGHSHYKTFDGKVFDFTGSCLYTLVRDAVDNTFSVGITNNKGCAHGKECFKNITVFVEEREYMLALDAKGDAVLALDGFQRIAIPSKTREFTIEMIDNFVILNLHTCGLTIKWNSKDYVQVDVSERLWNKTAGLCGILDGHMGNDLLKKDGTTPTSLLEFINSWEVNELEDQCSDTPSDLDACSRVSANDANIVSKAEAFCHKLLVDPKFSACRKVLDVKPYYSACRWDYCECNRLHSEECGCSAMSVFVRECSRLGVKEMPNWRDEATCPLKCENGKVYSTCGPAVQQTCGSVIETSVSENPKPVFCVEGCFCPEGTFLHSGKCIQLSECPCQLRGKEFPPGETVPSDCNTCRCEVGKWACTQAKCGARCSSIGDPHYITFDGRHFNFMGKCSYYLVKGNNYSIEAENVACAGSISEALNFPVSIASGLPSCTKTVKINYGGHSIKLKQNREIILNGEEVTTVPYVQDGFYIRMASSLFLMVELPNGLEVWWDGMTRAYIDAPSHLHGKTKGLCGTFNMNQKDDFLTPEGDVEQSVTSFANKWKTSESCEDLPEKFLESPCDMNIQKKALAEKHCQKLKGNIFQICHWFVDPEQYYQDCMYDMCSCEGKIGACLCPILSAYAKECARQGMKLDWRMEVRECGIHCPGTQRYQICGDSCSRSCFDISSQANASPCKRKCVEGCNCPEGETLDSQGQCIPIAQCPCLHKGVKFNPGHIMIMAGARDREKCTCRNAVWNCELATEKDLIDFPPLEHQRAACSSVKNEEFTDCEPAEPATCKNMHKPPAFSPAKCKAGCKCKKGFVLDTYSKTCIHPKDCPCHHGGKSFGESEVIQQDCNTCTCSSGTWNCTDSVCAGICTSWGESHFKTFDGKIYDFQGSCDYLFAKGKLSGDNAFEITIQNVPCGSSGITCSKSITLKVGSGERMETVTFSKGQPIPSFVGLKRLILREAGLFLYAEVSDLGLVLQWDRGTRIYLKLNTSWKNRIRGLCGNYNDNELDDFQTPSGGISEVSPVVFGDSWKVQQYCPESYEVKDTCLTHPNRKVWALQKCGILKSEVFQPCHSEVPLDPYLDRCIFDTCGCDMGGDCDCLCTAIAAYAHECNVRGVPIKWRTQQLCPMQCDESCSNYSPCVQTCPKQTCDNQFHHKGITQLCNEDACVEGCELKPCPKGEVYNSLEDLSCVPLSSCKKDCLTNGTTIYYEGDVIEEDACHSCYCSRHEKICTGKPCISTSTTPTATTTTSPPKTTATPPVTIMKDTSCVTGWSPWFSNDKPIGTKKLSDVELISNIPRHVIQKDQPTCEPSHVDKIECRTIGSHINFKETGQDVECSLERGLVCQPSFKKKKSIPCHDYEIRVHCLCEEITEIFTRTTVSLLTEEVKKCTDGLGMESGAILDDQISVSSFSTPGNLGNHARINGGGAWTAAKTTVPNEWIQVDLVDQKQITGILMQGNPNVDEWVTKFQVGWSNDGFKWIPVREEGGLLPKVFEGNTDHQTAKRVFFDYPLFAQYIKIVPVAFHKRISLRMEVLGCDIIAKLRKKVLIPTTKSTTTPSTTMPSTTTPSTTTTKFVERCDPGHPNFPHDSDCHLFYHCADTLDGMEMVQKSCGPDMMYHPEKFICDWPEAVLEVRPDCKEVEETTVPPCREGWTSWFNNTHPDIDNGDYETLANIRKHTMSGVCPGAHINDIECKFMKGTPSKYSKGAKKTTKSRVRLEFELVDYTHANQVVTCHKDVGLLCNNQDQDSHECMDYAVRFHCSCVPPETTTPRPTTIAAEETTSVCPPGKEWRDCAIRCDQVCLHFDYILTSQGLCSSKQDCISGCVDEYDAVCPLGFFWRDRNSCLEISDCTCRSHSGVPVKPGAVFKESDCEFCQCLNNEYICDKSACDVPTTVISTVKATPTTKSTAQIYTVTPSTAKPPEVKSQIKGCDHWSEWHSATSPKYSIGDFEPVETIMALYNFCDHPSAIECVTVNGEISFASTGDKVTCNLNDGLICHNSKNGRHGCNDYKIRIFCPCEKITTTEITTMGTTTGPMITSIPCDGWSEWINDSKQRKGHKDEREFKTEEELHEMGFCKNGEVTHIECRDTKTDLLFSETWDVDVTCSLSHGLLCRNDAQGKGLKCKDYKIRYYCSCGTSVQTTTISILHLTVTPPPLCDRNRFIPLINGLVPLPDDVFTASSSSSMKHGPQSARLGSIYSPISGLGWIPMHQNKDQFLQVDLGRNEPVYGVKVKGGSNMHVTSYTILHSEDGLKFSYVTDTNGKPKVFRGPIDDYRPSEEIFATPFEARYLRFNPVTWKNGISLMVEIIGCGEDIVATVPTTTPSIILTTPAEILCKDEMGLQNGMMSDEQIQVSSIHNYEDKFSQPNIRPNTPRDGEHGGAWIPNSNSLSEWVKFDFLEPRNLTGIITLGQTNGDSWVESYKVMYSHDGNAWNPIVVDDGSVKIFPGNFDADIPQENYFDRPINARYLKIMPLTWHENIALRVEVLGCFHPYPDVTTTTPVITTAPPPKECKPCPNLPAEALEECISCSDGLFWDGSDCVQKSECQCYVGHLPYAVGTVYKTEDCKQCTCMVGGTSNCEDIKCPKCAKGLRSEMTPMCGCVCKPCPEGTRICPTSEICIEDELWCNGIEDCPDDERNCTVSTTTACPTPECPPGYNAVMKTVVSLEYDEEPISRLKGGVKGGSSKKRLNRVKGGSNKPRKMPERLTSLCPAYDCIPDVTTTTQKISTCPPQKCPKGYEMITIDDGFMESPCPIFDCKMIKVIPDESVCKVNGRAFETFDGLEYNYDICHHILARDIFADRWSITVHKDCSICNFYLVIIQDSHTLKLNNDLTVEYGPNTYSADQVKKIGSKHKEFKVSRVGDALNFNSKYGFWVQWDGRAGVKIGVPKKLIIGVNGLCGFYNNEVDDDRQMPDGSQARTNKDFGDSWFIEGSEICETRVCPIEMQNKAWEICSLAKKKPFNKCKDIINMNKFETHCLETTCNCLEEKHNNSLTKDRAAEMQWEDECRCEALLHLVTQCTVAQDVPIDLSDWRVIHSCPALCPPGEVYKDCYTRDCEPSCGTLMNENPCPKKSNTCFSGCFCPDGLVRKGSSCVTPVECRDCTCDCFGDPHFLTFDRVNYTFNGNCTYVAARDIREEGGHDFQVLVKNKECIDKPAATCTNAITIIHGDHFIHLERIEEDKTIQVIVDRNTIQHFPHYDSWIKVERLGDKDVNVLIPLIQLEVSFYFDNFAFVIRLPSHLYADKTEGLCGNCNKNKMDELKKSEGVLTDDVEDFGMSWLVDLPPELGFEGDKDCKSTVIEECPPLPSDEDLCLKIMDEKKFGLCHPVVDPEPFLVSCRSDICHSTGKEKAVCQSLDAYARECSREGVCLEWKTDELCPFDCPEGLEFHQCGSGCFETCDIHNKTGICSMSSIDGCYCPSGKVWKDKKCVELSLCKACDEEGHFPGDIWYPNECEECSCSDSTTVCKVQTCPEVETVCESTMTAMRQPDAENECCPKYLCVPGTTPSTGCPEPQTPVCGYGQELKMVTSISGCKEYICVCVPVGKCEPLANPISPVEGDLDDYDPGIETWTDESGCCPRVIERCNLTLCPMKPDCPEHHELEKLPLSDKKCCPEYKCTPPKDVCLYDHEYTDNEDGGERLMREDEKFSSVRKVGDIWQDGPCRECACVEVGGGYTKSTKGGVKGGVKGSKGMKIKAKKVLRSSCSSTICPSTDEHPDAEDYVLDEVPTPGKCCPNIVRKACLDEGKIYQVGKEWSIPGDNCISRQCILSTNASLVIKQFKVQHCVKVCEEGWEYQEPPPGSVKCCGQCKQVACAADGKLHPVGTSWVSNDHCTTYYCREVEGMIQTQSVDVTCPQDAKLYEDFKVEVLPVEGSCCNKTFKVACLVGEHELKEGETFSVTKCRKVYCAVGPHKELVKQETEETCNKECQKGWEYEEPAEDSSKCCGECQQKACLTDDGELHPPGSKWETDDGCTKHTCVENGNQLQVTSSKEKCPDIDDCPPENVYSDKCCQKCNATKTCPTEGVCAPVPMEPPLTVALIDETKGYHGRCINSMPIDGFNECKGTCQSSTYFDFSSFTQQGNCKCCQATSTKSIMVQVMCEDGFGYERKVSSPTACACNVCDSSKALGNVKSFTKTGGVKTSPKKFVLKDADA